MTKETQNYKCWDCGEKIQLDKVGEILNGKLLKYDDKGEYLLVFKCTKCYEKPDGKELKHYQQNEVYSRVVGYLRPVQQYNKGKKLEYKQRKVYDTKKIAKKVQGLEPLKKD